MNGKSSVKELKGVGPKKAETLERLGITTLEDLARDYPRAYEDRRSPRPIAGLTDGEKALVRAKVLLVTKGRGFGKNRTLRILCEDESSRMEALFFHAAYLDRAFKNGDEYYFFGKVKNENGRITMFQPDFGPSSSSDEGILPVYPLSKGISQKDMRRLVSESLEAVKDDPETLPESVIKNAGVAGLSRALKGIHFPEDEKDFRIGRSRLIYEEFFYLRSALLLSRDRFGQGREGRSITSGMAERYISSLPYSLTGAQRRCLDEILSDMKSEMAMNRLLQGDVGSGKTAVAAAALCEAAGAGLQGAFMAPTEILARQHYNNLSKALSLLGIKVDILTGSLSAQERRSAYERLRSGETDIAVGTHAVISEGVVFRDLGLVITDEQHRFGVNQRKKLSLKGTSPDVLVMTATPIPRTLAVVLYGDLDVSVIDEMPPGRIPIDTRKYIEQSRKEAYSILLDQVRQGRQAYIVAPFIDDPEDMEGRSAEGIYAEFCKEHPDISCALLHGAMKQAEKDRVMESFVSGEVSVLVSTVVIEVGIDVPNANVMIIENSERFGLAQLHQLRGRVGRGAYKSWCLLILGEDQEIARQRADILCSSGDGFYIAEMDLGMRGPGELFGFRQHGLPQLSLADPAKHIEVARKAGEDAARLLEEDPSLTSPENAYFGARLREKFAGADSLTL